jgi:hypothetical protein
MSLFASSSTSSPQVGKNSYRNSGGGELSISLRKKAKESLQGAATEEAAIELDAELPAYQQQLQDIIIRKQRTLPTNV